MHIYIIKRFIVFIKKNGVMPEKKNKTWLFFILLLNCSNSFINKYHSIESHEFIKLLFALLKLI